MRHGQLRWARAFVLVVLAMSMLVGPSSRSFAQSDPCPEPNDSAANACELTPGAPVQGNLDRLEDVDAYRVSASGGGVIQLDLTGLSNDIDLYLADSNSAVMGQSVKEGATPERIQLTVQPGTYYAFVSTDPARASGTASPYTLTLTMAGSAPAKPAAKPAAQTDGDVIFADNFDDPSGGRLPKSSDDPTHYERGYVDGEYQLRKVDPTWANTAAFRIPGQPQFLVVGDARVTIDVRVVGGTENRHMFIDFREQNNGADFYRFNIYPHDGRFRVSVYNNRTVQAVLADWQPAAGIRRGNETNTIELRFVGPNISASLNGQNTFEARDETLSGEGRIAIGAGGFGSQAADVRLDNLVVRRP